LRREGFFYIKTKTNAFFLYLERVFLFVNLRNMETLTIPLDYVIIFIFAYALATIITYKLMKGSKEAESRILEFKK